MNTYNHCLKYEFDSPTAAPTILKLYDISYSRISGHMRKGFCSVAAKKIRNIYKYYINPDTFTFVYNTSYEIEMSSAILILSILVSSIKSYQDECHQMTKAYPNKFLIIYSISIYYGLVKYNIRI